MNAATLAATEVGFPPSDREASLQAAPSSATAVMPLGARWPGRNRPVSA
jgi:hypothetical protein